MSLEQKKIQLLIAKDGYDDRDNNAGEKVVLFKEIINTVNTDTVAFTLTASETNALILESYKRRLKISDIIDIGNEELWTPLQNTSIII